MLEPRQKSSEGWLSEKKETADQVKSPNVKSPNVKSPNVKSLHIKVLNLNIRLEWFSQPAAGIGRTQPSSVQGG